MAAKCSGNDRPEWGAKLWAGDSQNQAITRAQDNESISTADPIFNEYVCVSFDDMLRLEKEVLQKCAKWKAAPSYMSTEQIPIEAE